MERMLQEFPRQRKAQDFSVKRLLQKILEFHPSLFHFQKSLTRDYQGASGLPQGCPHRAVDQIRDNDGSSQERLSAEFFQ